MAKRRSLLLFCALLMALSSTSTAAAREPGNHDGPTSTPIQHLVVIFQENVSFDHYFGTYPNAANPAGEPAFHARPGTPRVNGLTPELLSHNPNLSNPQRLDRSQARTCDQDHEYTHEQEAFDGGRMDHFVQSLSGGGQTVAQCAGTASGVPPNYAVMDYYDGNTVTGLWNYAQRFAMSDSSFETGFGPSTVGALNLAAGNTYGARCGDDTANAVYKGVPCKPAPPASGEPGTGTVFGDPQPLYDKCTSRDAAAMGGRNIGDLANARGVSWGFFEGGFSNCKASHTYLDQFGKPHQKADYIPHHQPFQYYASTANPQHLPPSAPSMVGRTDQANHQYDLTDFWPAVDSGHLPAVSFLKAPGYQDGHAGYSNPLDEQVFLAETINRLQKLPTWSTTAVVIAYDDSDGWYDHAFGPTRFASRTPLDALNGPGRCGESAERVPTGSAGPQQVRCGYGPRLPLLVVSPFARSNYVDHHLTDQASILRFIEDNWGLGRIGNGSADQSAGTLNNLFDFEHPHRAPLLLDPTTGQPI